jgi:dolichyl-phosphate-mannose-protein mannosyltransferase
VAYNSIITLRHVDTQGRYLHSHPHNYPGDSKQQQTRLYPHTDKNSEWKIIPLLDPNANTGSFPVPSVPVLSLLMLVSSANASSVMETLTYIKLGMDICLLHTSTRKHLHLHDVRPPVSKFDFQNEVSCYGFEGFEGGTNDNWVMQLDESAKFFFFLFLHLGFSTHGL